jgi:hypothetical protein
VACAAATSIAAGQKPPGSDCGFEGFDVHANLAEVSRPTTAYYNCEAGKKCSSMPVQAGDTLVISRSKGDWTCGYLTGRKGAAQGWILSEDFHVIEADPNPPLTAWIGNWMQAENRITIEASKTPGKLALDGEAYWRGGRDNLHEGAIAGEITPKGNYAHYEEGSRESCIVDLALIGNYLLANDNSLCGGMNVRFWGVWRRTPRGRRKLSKEPVRFPAIR